MFRRGSAAAQLPTANYTLAPRLYPSSSSSLSPPPLLVSRKAPLDACRGLRLRTESHGLCRPPPVLLPAWAAAEELAEPDWLACHTKSYRRNIKIAIAHVLSTRVACEAASAKQACGLSQDPESLPRLTTGVSGVGASSWRVHRGCRQGDTCTIVHLPLMRRVRVRVVALGARDAGRRGRAGVGCSRHRVVGEVLQHDAARLHQRVHGAVAPQAGPRGLRRRVGHRQRRAPQQHPAWRGGAAGWRGLPGAARYHASSRGVRMWFPRGGPYGACRLRTRLSWG